MAGETTITVVGNLTDDPELRFTPSGAAVAKFRIASTPRTMDRQSGEWKDGEPLFLACNVWRQAAENVAESLQRGARVIVSGPAAPAVVRDARGREAHRLSSSRSTRSARRCATPRRRCRRCRGPAAAAAASAPPVAVAAGGGSQRWRRRQLRRPVGHAAPASAPLAAAVAAAHLRRRATVLIRVIRSTSNG